MIHMVEYSVSWLVSQVVAMHTKVRYDFALTATSLCEALFGWEAKGGRGGAVVYVEPRPQDS
jgi:hypothetical protein